VVREDFTGEIRGREVVIQNTSYSFIQQGRASSWFLDTVSGEVSSDGDQINGIVSDEREQEGEAIFWSARSLE